MYTSFMKAILYNPPVCKAVITGSQAYPMLSGSVLFYEANNGTIVVADLTGLAEAGKEEESCGVLRFYGFHIHEGSRCGETAQSAEPFSAAGSHWNPKKCAHPAHAGDLPVLLSNYGRVWSACYTEAFMPWELPGHTVILHDRPDDYRAQPAGDAGERIGCGRIVAFR